ncbi:hypothetical protein [Trinickia symbiotica]|uniref:hypothetical protein n=1 Tax=Trinickia symbiotica TaxID=863227 RepID=UPI0011B1C714|nr:hypothetical protein [Trinickia symbiotica]
MNDADYLLSEQLSEKLKALIARKQDSNSYATPYEQATEVRNGGRSPPGKIGEQKNADASRRLKGVDIIVTLTQLIASARIASRHTKDILILFGSYLVLLLIVIASAIVAGVQNDFLHSVVGATGLGVFVTLIRQSYELANKRLSAVDLFAGEVVSIGRVFAAGNIIGAFIGLYLQTGTGRWSPTGFGDVSRKENYFTVFEKTVDGLGPLGPEIVGNIASFYTFMKAARDATGVIGLWASEGYHVFQVRADIIDIVYLCFLQMIHGRRALSALIEANREKSVAENIFVGVELQCFGFLYNVLPPTDYRYAVISARRKGYFDLSREHGYTELFSKIDRNGR